MSKPTTTRGYISLLMKVASVSIESLKGIEDLSEEIQKELIFIRGEIYNTIGEIDKEQVKDNKVHKITEIEDGKAQSVTDFIINNTKSF